MRYKFLFISFAALASAIASADHNWHLESTYTYAMTGDFGTSSLRDVEKIMQGDDVDHSYGWGVSSSFNGGNSNTTSLSLDTYPFFGNAAPQPVLERSLLYGVMDALPTDAIGQEHLVIFMDPFAASQVNHVAFGTVFGITDQGGAPITEERTIDALNHVHRDDLTDEEKLPYYDDLNLFNDHMATFANVGIGGSKGSIWFAPGGFSIVTFSDGEIVGSGTNTFTTAFSPVPEPASMAALGAGALALLRRRKRA